MRAGDRQRAAAAAGGLALGLALAAAAVAPGPVAGQACVWEATTTIGSTGGGPGQFLAPTDVAWSGLLQFWVADRGNHRIVRYDWHYEYLSEIGGFGPGLGQFDEPIALSAHDFLAGHVLVAERGNRRIQDCGGECTLFADGYEPGGLAVGVDGTTPYVFVTDVENHRIVKYDLAGQLVDTWGTFGSGAGELDGPTGILVTDVDDRVLVADTGNDRIQAFGLDGTFLYEWGTGLLSAPRGLGSASPCWVAGRGGGAVAVADTGHDRVLVYDVWGRYLGVAAASAGGVGFPMAAPEGVGDHPWIFLVADTGNDRLVVIEQVTSVETSSWGRIRARYRR